MSGNFFDTNVFVYLMDNRDTAKRSIAEDLIFTAVANQSGTISYQVVQETLSVLLHKMPRPITVLHASRFFDEILQPFWTTMPSPELYRHALEIQGRYAFHFYDALIVAASLSAGCDTLYSEDMQHGQRIQGLTIVNPFSV
ncbi:twitching motility protein PilT [bacterium SCGC AG-212-C10]|nr:twitching motility protein PilT [bacterium SCGC AG-212-C10]